MVDQTELLCPAAGPLSDWCQGFRVNGRSVTVSNPDVIVNAGDVLTLKADRVPEDATLPIEGHVTVNGA